MNATDYLDVEQRPRGQRQLRRALMQLSEAERFAFVVDMLELRPLLAWALANACLRRRDLTAEVLRRSLLGTRLVYVERLLKAMIPRVGFRRTVRVVGEVGATRPEVVHFAAYHLPKFVNLKSSRDVRALERFQAASEASGLLLGPIRVRTVVDTSTRKPN